MTVQQMPILYKEDSTGRKRFWFIEYEDDRYRMVSGLDKPVRTEWTVCQPKNVGRSNATTGKEQRRLEVSACYEKKRKEGYAEEGKAPVVKAEPMLAQDYHKRRDKIDWSRTKVFSQPKLDGIRCLATVDGLFTRRGERIVSCPHIEEQLMEVRRKFPIGPHMVFDGELYNHNLRDDFNSIASLVRRQKCSEEQLAQTAEVVQYHIYDASGSDFVFGDRWNLLYTFLGFDLEFDALELVQTERAETPEALDYIYADYLGQGYEGQMVRLDHRYEHKRSAHLLKRKEFLEEEFVVASIDEGVGNRSGMAGRVTLLLKDGRTFGAGIKGGTALNRELLENAEAYVGQEATVRFQNYTPDGIPRFPVVKDIGRRD